MSDALHVAVLGMWHLGCVTAAGSASVGHQVIAYDHDPVTVNELTQAKPPIAEPGLDELWRTCLDSGHLEVTNNLTTAVDQAEVVWITYDTPVDDQDRADVTFVTGRIIAAMPLCRHNAVILVSSQLPAGTGRSLQAAAKAFGRNDLAIACSPENLRLGQALQVFRNPDRVICGVSSDAARIVLKRLWSPITTHVEWMSVASAEMTKHAINAFLAMSVAYANEIARTCEAVGADAKDVERGLKTESRIGSKAYVGPGLAFAGGTLARDIAFLSAIGEAHGQASLLFPAVRASNDRHKSWTVDTLERLLGGIRGRTIALWGLTYKPGTDTLRRSASMECAAALVAAGATVRVHDPAINALPPEWAARLALTDSPLAAATGADAVALCTPWPLYREVPFDSLAVCMRQPLVIDPTRFLSASCAAHPLLRYAAIGLPPQP